MNEANRVIRQPNQDYISFLILSAKSKLMMITYILSQVKFNILVYLISERFEEVCIILLDFPTFSYIYTSQFKAFHNNPISNGKR